jgi:putative membrane-bound dehydrogenase-like protein
MSLAVGMAPVLVFAQVPPDKATSTMKVAPDLQIELFAHEPDLINPTSIDVDHLGRVWVCEAVNYRRMLFRRPMLRPEGDRIVILEDTKGVGKADKVTVFYQGKDLIAPLGIAVAPIPNGKPGACKVYVCQSPDILVFEDLDGDGKADGPPKKLLSGFRGIDHDHGVHGINIGPDGKLYFTVGDEGVRDLQSSDGKGRKWTSNETDCRAGTVWRCDMDGKNLELIAHNFRNPYECCINSFGDIWLSDNDDDGSQQTRVCYVMPGGDYGYHPRGPGQSHWHEEKPGVVHKVLRTGFGAPTGMCFYEGTLLPERFRGQLLQCDAGPREFRRFEIKPKGAGFELEKEVLVTSSDSWFRPSDVCVAPDGSIFLADWYDPGVGGHGMGDWTRGRIYRVTPKGHKGYKVPLFDANTRGGLPACLESPCLATRAQAMLRLRELKEGHPEFENAVVAVAMMGLQPRSSQPWLVARALWQRSKELLNTFMAYDSPQSPGDENDRIACQRIRQFAELNPTLTNLSSSNKTRCLEAVASATPAIRRELSLALRNAEPALVHEFFPDLANLCDGQDHFYLAALNIACGTDPIRRSAILADFDKQFPDWNDKVADLVWELRPKSMLPKLEVHLKDSKLIPAEKARIVNILAEYDSVDAGKSTLLLLKAKLEPEVKNAVLDNLKRYLPGKWKDLRNDPLVDELVKRFSLRGSDVSVALTLIVACQRFNGIDLAQQVAKDDSESSGVRRLAIQALGEIPNINSFTALEEFVWNQRDIKDRSLVAEAINSLNKLVSRGTKYTYASGAMNTLKEIAIGANLGADMKSSALAALASNPDGSAWLIERHNQGRLPNDLVAETGRLLRNSPFQEIRNKAKLAFPPPGKLDPSKLPPISILARRSGDANRGHNLIASSLHNEAQCLKCHTIRGFGGQVGPDLSMIGKKASRENLLESILLPSKAIAEQYMQWLIETKQGQQIMGLLVEENSDSILLRDANGKDHQIAKSDIESRTKSPVSIMPADIVKAFSEDELIDVVEYLLTLKTPSLTLESWHIIGPFANDESDSGLDSAREPETKVDLGASYKGKSGEVKWSTVRRNADGYIDLQAHYAPASEHIMSYCFREIESPVEQEATISLGTDDGSKLWVNGERVYETRAHDAAVPDKARVKVKLKKGLNSLLLKIVNGNNPHGFYLTILSEQELKGR